MEIKKQHVIYSIICAFSLLPITFVWFISKGHIPIGQDLSKSDWLLFWGSYLSFFGTIFLGGITLWQNSQLQKINKKLTEQNSRGQFFSEINPKSLEIIKKRIEDPISSFLISNNAQILLRSENSDEKIMELLFFRLIFSSSRPFLPNFYKIKRIHFRRVLHKLNEEILEEEISGFCNPKQNQEFFRIGNRTSENSIILPIFINVIENDENYWKLIVREKEISIIIEFVYKNPFGILTNACIETKLCKDKHDRYYSGKFKAIEHVIVSSSYENVN